MLKRKGRFFLIAGFISLAVLVPTGWWVLKDLPVPEADQATGSAPAGMERPGFIPPAAPGPVRPVAVNLADVAPGQYDPHNKFDRWRRGNVNLKERDRIVGEARFEALRAAAGRLVPNLDVQNSETAGPSALSPSPGAGFDSLDYTQCCGGGGNVPPDPQLAAGPNHLIAAVNVAFEIYDKNGLSLRAPTTFESFMNANSNCTNVFDPNALYDEASDRFILTIATQGGYFCAAVSQSGDPTGQWWIYAFQMASGNEFFDYPHAGVGRDAIFVGANIFTTLSFKEGRVYALDKTAMYAGQPATYVSQALGIAYDSSQPLNLHGSAQGTWPTSGPHYFISDSNYDGAHYAIHAWSDPFGANNLTLKGTVDLNASTGVTAGMPLTVPQNGSGVLDGGDWRPQDFEYQDGPGDGYGWTVMAIACNPGSGSVNCVRWAKIDLANATVVDSGVYGSDGIYRTYGDLAVNQCGDMAVGYTKSGSSMYPSVWYTGREAVDAAGTLQAESELKAGELAYTAFDGSTYRWGDYTGMTIDPDGQTFWYLGQYSRNTGTTNGRWGTYIGSFSYAACTGGSTAAPPNAAFSFSTADLTATFTDTSSDSDGTIASWSWNFGDGSTATVQNPSHTYAAAGTYTVTLTVTDNDGLNGSVTNNVAVFEPTNSTSVHIANLDGTAVNSGKNWRARVTATVRDDGSPSAAVSGALVSGSWTGDTSGTGSCTTDQTGSCAIESNAIPKKQTNSVVFTVTGITNTGSLTYQPLDNSDPDGNSSGTAIQVNKDGTTQNPGSQPPSAGFTVATSDLTATFTDTSSDSDGTVVSWDWNFGDNSTATGQGPQSHTYGAAGTYAVTLSVTDNDGLTDSVTNSVTVPTATGTLHIGNLDDTSSAGSHGRWTAAVTATVLDGTGAAVSGASVSADWAGGTNGSSTCVTGSNGQCQLSKQAKSGEKTATLVITGISLSSYTYDASSNTDPDGDSNGTQIIVFQPQ